MSPLRKASSTRTDFSLVCVCAPTHLENQVVTGPPLAQETLKEAGLRLKVGENVLSLDSQVQRPQTTH